MKWLSKKGWFSLAMLVAYAWLIVAMAWLGPAGFMLWMLTMNAGILIVVIALRWKWVNEQRTKARLAQHDSSEWSHSHELGCC